MKVLAIVDIDLKVDVKYISQAVSEEVTLNSVSNDGVSIFVCGTPIPETNWDWVAKIGTCMAEISVPIDLDISIDEDPIGNLIAAISAVQDGQANDEDLGE